MDELPGKLGGPKTHALMIVVNDELIFSSSFFLNWTLCAVPACSRSARLCECWPALPDNFQL